MIPIESRETALNQAESRLHESGLIDVVSDLATRLPGSKVVLRHANLEIGSYIWPGVSVQLPEIQDGDELKRLTLCFESMLYVERFPQIRLYGWLDRLSNTGTSSFRIPFGHFDPNLCIEFPSPPSTTLLRSDMVPKLLNHFCQALSRHLS